MPKLLVFQHVAHELLGTLNPFLKQSGFRIRYVNFERDPQAQPALDGYDGLIILGGPMNVDETDKYAHLLVELDLIKQALDRKMPVFGICLGAQLMAKALGAQVMRNHVKEIGWYDVSLSQAGKNDPLLGHLGATEKIFQWHGDTFQIPQGAIHLVSSPTCANQAFRYGDRAYGFQFHMEVDQPMIDRWLKIPANVVELEGLQGQIDPQVIRRETPLYIERLQQLSQKTFSGFAGLCGAVSRKAVLTSR